MRRMRTGGRATRLMWSVGRRRWTAWVQGKQRPLREGGRAVAIAVSGVSERSVVQELEVPSRRPVLQLLGRY